MDLLKYQKQIHEINVSKGFWDEGPKRNKGEMVMLMVSELGEALDAHRIYRTYQGSSETTDFLNLISANLDSWTGVFREEVKDTYQDEMADTVIRLLDYCYGWGINLDPIEHRPKESTGNFGHDLLRLNYHLITAFHGDLHKGDPGHPQTMIVSTWEYALFCIISFCKWWNIDIEQHVQWKIRYNSTRPHKHNKAY